MPRFLIMILLAVVFPHLKTNAETPAARNLDRELCEWKGLPVNLTIDNSDAILAIEGAYSIKKNEATAGHSDESLTITAADSTGLRNGIYFLLRAQQQRDTCLCITLPHYDIETKIPLFTRRVAVYDSGSIRNFEKERTLTEIARRDAMTGINGWLVEGDEEESSKHSAKTDGLKSILSQFGIALHQNRDALGTAPELNDEGNVKFMGDIWQRQMTEASRKGYRCVIYHFEPSAKEHPMRDINMYAFGRLASDATVNARRIAYEWLAKTYSDNPLTVRPLMESLQNGDETDFCTKLKEIGTY